MSLPLSMVINVFDLSDLMRVIAPMLPLRVLYMLMDYASGERIVIYGFFSPPAAAL